VKDNARPLGINADAKYAEVRGGGAEKDGGEGTSKERAGLKPGTTFGVKLTQMS